MSEDENWLEPTEFDAHKRREDLREYLREMGLEIDLDKALRRSTIGWYRLVNGVPVPAGDDMAAFFAWYEDRKAFFEEARVDRHVFADGSMVSTVFLALDHGNPYSKTDDYKPVLWETLISKSTTDFTGSEVVERYISLQDAKAGHWKWVDKLLKEGKQLTEEPSGE